MAWIRVEYGVRALLLASLAAVPVRHCGLDVIAGPMDAAPPTVQTGLLRATTAWFGPGALASAPASGMAKVPLGLRN